MTGSLLRSLLCEWVLKQVGSTDPEPYYHDAAPCYAKGTKSGKEWCGIFALAGLRAIGLADWVWKDRDGFLFRLGWAAQNRQPRMGDICYLDHPYQHHCIVVAVEPAAGTCQTVGGNEGPRPGHVGEPVTRRIADPRLIFFSIQKLVDKADPKGWRKDETPDTERSGEFGNEKGGFDTDPTALLETAPNEPAPDGLPGRP